MLDPYDQAAYAGAMDYSLGTAPHGGVAPPHHQLPGTGMPPSPYYHPHTLDLSMRPPPLPHLAAHMPSLYTGNWMMLSHLLCKAPEILTSRK